MSVVTSKYGLDSSYSRFYAKQLERIDGAESASTAIKLQLSCAIDAINHLQMALFTFFQGTVDRDLSRQGWHIVRALSFAAQACATPLILVAPHFAITVRETLSLDRTWEPSTLNRCRVLFHRIYRKSKTFTNSLKNSFLVTVLKNCGPFIAGCLTLLISYRFTSLYFEHSLPKERNDKFPEGRDDKWKMGLFLTVPIVTISSFWMSRWFFSQKKYIETSISDIPVRNSAEERVQARE